MRLRTIQQAGLLCAWAFTGSACGEETAPAPRQQATTLEVPQPNNRKGLVQVPNEWDTPFENPAPLTELVAARPELGTLPAADQTLLTRILNVVPSTCGACPDVPLARCLVTQPEECPNIDGLLQRATRLIASGADPTLVRASVSYPDEWFALPSVAAESTEDVQVHVWIDLDHPSLGSLLATVEKFPTEGVAIVPHFRVTDPEGTARAQSAIAAHRQGHLWPFLARYQSNPSEALQTGPDVADFDVQTWKSLSASDEVSGILQEDAALAERVGVRAVPTWFIDGYRLRGAQSDLALGRAIGLALSDRTGPQ